nr:TonB family protein [uncultured Sphingomonas sp.]
MRLWQWARELRPAGLLLYGAIGAILIALVALPRLFPDGLEVAGPTPDEGLLAIGSDGWEGATFHPLALLVENEQLRAKGQQRVGELCLDPAAARAELDRAFGRTRADRSGTRAVWVKLVARKYLVSNACTNRNRTRAGRHYGYVYRITALRAVHPIDCGYLRFIFNSRRCPAPPSPPKAIHIDDAQSYPTEALGRGAQGLATIEALVGPGDKVIACKVTASTGDAALDRAACDVFAANARSYAGKGSTAGLASGVRRIRTRIRFELEKPAPNSARPAP